MFHCDVEYGRGFGVLWHKYMGFKGIAIVSCGIIDALAV
jgi:hypothetical protein